MTRINTVLRELTFADLSDWAGDTMLNRGKSYLKQVAQLSRTDDDTLVAWVDGSDRYTTSVQIDSEHVFDHSCTCPYPGGVCKHAVAVILAAAGLIKNKRRIPLLDDTSDLGQALRDGPVGEDVDWEEAMMAVSTKPRARKATFSKVARILEQKSRDQLLVLLTDLSAKIPAVAQHVIETDQLAQGQVDQLTRSLRAEIRQLTAEPSWYNPWQDEGRLPDYDHLQQQLQALAGRGHADALMKLGEELWTRGNTQVEQSDDEGHAAQAIASCLAIVLTAVPKSSLPPHEQLLWVIDRMLEDEYALLEAGEAFLELPAFTPAHWRRVCETLETRLRAMPKPRTVDFSSTYHRERLLRRLLDGYARAEWKARIVPLLETEAHSSRCYLALVDALQANGDNDRARHWCIEGYKRTATDAAGIASALQERLRTIAQEEGRHDLAAAYRAKDFFALPSRSTYRELKKAATKAKCWPAVRDAVLDYLETGASPGTGGPQGSRDDWPLPATEIESPVPSRQRFKRLFPNLDTLIDIALMEKRLDDAVELYQRLRKTKRWGWETNKSVALAVADTHPDIALDIWREIVERLIAQVKPKAYEEAAGYLRRMEKVYARLRRQEEWRNLIDRLRREHKAKRRLMGVLDSLSGRKLVD